ncbi:MAG: hypothetical protein PHU98_10550 [Mariniphaga sp.]|nr:hypothetical protein [Mariniphaga sp.]
MKMICICTRTLCVLIITNAELTAQTLEMEIKIPAVFNLQFIRELQTDLPAIQTPDSVLKPLNWLEITGNENVEIVVCFNHMNDTARAFYINSGNFDLTQAVPFVHNTASFVLNGDSRYSGRSTFYKAWIGILDDDWSCLTFEYP